ncbi:putative ATPase [Marmoricola sp. URHA0025 HA25]
MVSPDPAATIRTPDQRLRVFVSSTLKELAPERKIVRQAVERLAATPVMFELGARPHPPRELYRAYLEQSDIFVGLYWDRYGWVAPGEVVSGLEDEYNLAPAGMPRLIYIKDSAGKREARLEELLERFGTDDLASYKSFADPGDLGELLVADLAVLLAERFDQSRTPAAPAPEQPAPPEPTSGNGTLPVPLTHLVGREPDLEALTSMMTADETRLVTLTGPGGVGKTRLAIEVARRVEHEFPDGVTYVPLAPAQSAAGAASAIAQGLGALDTGDLPLEQKLTTAVGDRRGLLVLDNFEQVVDAAPLVAAMLRSAPGLRVLVTSRVLLRITGEHSYPVAPLETSFPGGQGPGAALSPAAELFVQQARSVKPDFELTPENADVVEQIAATLEGLPLAIELAAARIRILPPASLLERLDRQLSVLVGGSRDAPVRHQTVRSAIEWSTDLLDEEERDLLWQLGVFSGPSSLDAIEAVSAASRGGTDTLSLIGGLVDASLVRQRERHDRPYFTLLATVREYALEQLDARGLLAEVRSRHAHYYADWGARSRVHLLGPRQRAELAALTDERDNLRGAAQHMVDSHDWETLAELSFSLYPYWWLVGLLGEVRGRLDALLRSGEPASERATAIALWLTSLVSFFQGSDHTLTESLTRSADLFAAAGDPVGQGSALTSLGLAYATADPPDLAGAKECLQEGTRLLRDAGDTWSETVALIPLGRLHLLEGDTPGAIEQFSRALQLAEDDENDFGITLALNSLGWMRLFTGQLAEAAALMERCLDLAIGLSSEHGIVYQLESFLGVAGVLGDVERAGLLGGASIALRERLGLLNPSDAVLHLGIVERIRTGPDAELYERSVQEGHRMSVDEAIALARRVAASATAVDPTWEDVRRQGSVDRSPPEPE